MSKTYVYSLVPIMFSFQLMLVIRLDLMKIGYQEQRVNLQQHDFQFPKIQVTFYSWCEGQTHIHALLRASSSRGCPGQANNLTPLAAALLARPLTRPWHHCRLLMVIHSVKKHGNSYSVLWQVWTDILNPSKPRDYYVPPSLTIITLHFVLVVFV
jgi:hypothetical protein